MDFMNLGVPEWLGINLYADVRPGDPVLTQVAADD
jgi:hypothetical protein